MQETHPTDTTPKLLRRTVLKSTAASATFAVFGGRAVADEHDDDLPADDDEEFAAVVFPNQVTDGSSIDIEWARLPEGGFISIVDPVAAHESLWPIEGELMPSLEELVATQVRGVTPFLEAGEHEDVVLELDDPLEGEKLYQVWVHRDTTGTETFDYVDSVGEEDGPYPAPFDPDDDEEVDEDAETIPPGTEIELDGQTGGWVGIAPAEIEGEQNPTLTLEDGESYELGWTQGDGQGHNIAIRDEDGDTVDGLSTSVTTDPGDDQWLEFDASEEMVEYVCEPHSGTMVGDIVVQTDEDDPDDEENDEDAANDEENGEEAADDEENGEDEEEEREEAAGPEDPTEEEDDATEIHPTQVPNIVMGDAYLHRLEDPDEDPTADETADVPAQEEEREEAAGPDDPTEEEDEDQDEE
ncbi:cupredoxin domain-containing protein [Natrononativus amylolyticus]|uniref:cupredoxin domain-containing protein n=1 Tax=Natrononativus amylolyticus TaxID=2963434 RepID=UPI0020CD4E8E|nr:plastocyanin/azurin family copper-binding protein [Natrononativus amylolyticus]